MKVAILIEDLFDEREFIYPYYRFLEEGYLVDTISLKKKEIVSKHGFKILVDKSIFDMFDSLYEIVFIPGGYSPDKLRANSNILEFVKKNYIEGKIIAAICHGPWVLVSAGILEGKKATGYISIKDDLKNCGAYYEYKKVVIDKNIITATDPSALPLMMKKIFTRFQ